MGVCVRERAFSPGVSFTCQQTSACELLVTVHELPCSYPRTYAFTAEAIMVARTCGMQMGLFSLGAVQALAAALIPLCAWLLPHQTITPPIGEVHVHAILSLGLSVATVAVWLVFRTSSWAWALQDLLGMSLIVMVLRQFRLPNIKVSTANMYVLGNGNKLKTCCMSAHPYTLHLGHHLRFFCIE